jgi:hypothetical protein
MSYGGCEVTQQQLAMILLVDPQVSKVTFRPLPEYPGLDDAKGILGGRLWKDETVSQSDARRLYAEGKRGCAET